MAAFGGGRELQQSDVGVVADRRGEDFRLFGDVADLQQFFFATCDQGKPPECSFLFVEF
jgi:hypothetical protein